MTFPSDITPSLHLKSQINHLVNASPETKFTMSWQRLIKFEDAEGKVHFGEPVVDGDKDVEINDVLQSSTLKAKCYSGPSIFSTTATDQVVEVKKILPLLSTDDVPIVKCIGLNYMKHSKPPYPDVPSCVEIDGLYSPGRWTEPATVSIGLHQAQGCRSRL